MADSLIAYAHSSLAADTLRAIEARAEVDGLGDLHQLRRELLTTLAPLKAMHGHNGLYDDRRKQLLEALKVRARMKFTQDGTKVTEGAVEAAAYADEQYERFLDDGYSERITYIEQASILSEIEERIRSREIELLCYNAESKLR